MNGADHPFTSGVKLAFLTTLVLALDASAQPVGERDSLPLIDAVMLARERHPSLGAARAEEEASYAAVGQATAARWPLLTTTASLTTFEEPMLVAPLHTIELRQAPRFEHTLLRGDLTLAYTLFDGGGRGARVRGARAGAAGAGAARAAAEMGLTARVTGAYLDVLTAAGLLEAEDRRLEALVAERGRVEQLLAEGRAARVQLLRVEAALAAAEAERVTAAARLDLAERALARLVGVSPDSTRAGRLLPVRLRGGQPLEARSALVEKARAANPELERARQALTSAQASYHVARAAWLPRLDLVGSYLAFGSTSGGGTSEWQAGVSVSYPLFTGGSRSSAVGAAHARAREAQEKVRLAELEVEERVDRALSAAREARAQVEAMARAVQHQSEVVRIEKLSLEAGVGTQTDYLRAEADLLQARSGLVQARHAEIAARVELARTVGDLSAAWLRRNLEVGR